jgi:hypothetical protein
MDRSLSSETSTCSRTLDTKGFLTEIVRLNGSRGDLTDEVLEQSVASFPVQIAGAGEAR